MIDDLIQNMHAPSAVETYKWINDRLWKITYVVSNGYGGSKIVSKWSQIVQNDSEIARMPYENER